MAIDTAPGGLPGAESIASNADATAKNSAYIDGIPQTSYVDDSFFETTSDGGGQCAAKCACAKCQKCPCGGSNAGAQDPAATAYKGLFYKNDFSYLERSGAVSGYVTDALKRISVGSFFTFDVGGEYRLRNHNERNMGGVGSTDSITTFCSSGRVCIPTRKLAVGSALMPR